ncbi:uncharacterized protein LOC131617783 [Vicia villosa]|uniref:uncharacterized protein LOC131617783 n=1 Tax=Vicia villosa TaxID=3911 RepID=UPI00273BD88D|nr:uncharacterized protein LOC131617783 [Vicia villosa]
MNTSCQLKYQIIATLTQGMKTNSNIIKFTQLFISISVLSFIFTPSSLFVFLHYFKFYFSTLPFQLYAHNIDKNSMFLLCNGLLVFVGLTKSFLSSSIEDDKPSNNSQGLLSSQYIEVEHEEGAQSLILDVEAKEKILDRDGEQRTSEPHKQIAKEEEEKNIENLIMIDEEEEEMKEVEEEVELFDGEDEEEDKGSEIDYVLIEEYNIEEEDYVEEEESNMLSTEELNKKFEDFIRKMKEDLRMDARRQLIMV